MSLPEIKSSVPITSRDEDNRKRKQRLDKMKRGPGIFVYDGEAVDPEYVPTILLHGKSSPEFDQQGMPLLDSSGRQVFKKFGSPVVDQAGRPQLGGPPKVVRHPVKVKVVRGVEFPAGKQVQVLDGSLALKLRCLGGFTEINDEAEVAPKKGPGRPKKVVEQEPDSEE